jgi:hypothetical protein
LAKLEASARMDQSTSRGDDPNNLLQLCIEASRERYVLQNTRSMKEKSSPMLIA